MGKGSTRRSCNEQKVRENWPFKNHYMIDKKRKILFSSLFKNVVRKIKMEKNK